MAEWSFQRKLITGVIAICLLAILTSAASLLASRILITNMTEIATGEGLDLKEARALQLLGAKNIGNVQACLLNGGQGFAQAVQAGSSRFRDLGSRMLARTANSSSRRLIQDVLAAEADHQAAFALALTGPRAPPRAATSYPAVVLSHAARLDLTLDRLVAHMESARVRGLVPAQGAVNRSELLLIVITVMTILLLVVLCLLLIAVLNRSYGLQMTARTVAEHGQSEARASLSEAEAAGRLKDEFLATVSHELRNPLAPILTWTQLLRSGSLDEAKTLRALEVIERNVVSQAQLIDDLVDVSRVVSGKFRLEVRSVDLVPLIQTAVEAQAPAIDAKKIRLQLVLDERAGMISGDSARLQQVMWNLISNAIKFTPRGGTVQVLLQRVESHVEIAVSDSGMGIDAEFLPHVFEPFQQASGGSMRRHGGLGLGLSIVRHIVELHGGEISAHSLGLNLGSKFVLKFPLLATARVADPVKHRPIAGEVGADIDLGRLDGIRLLVVDDEPIASEALQALFDSCGAEARVAGSAAEALDVFDSWHPDVLISDIAMPGEDGYSLIRKIRKHSLERGGGTPAVALTAYAKIGDRVTILAAGFQMYLSKPADPNELVAVVKSLATRNERGEPGGVA